MTLLTVSQLTVENPQGIALVDRVSLTLEQGRFSVWWAKADPVKPLPAGR